MSYDHRRGYDSHHSRRHEMSRRDERRKVHSQGFISDVPSWSWTPTILSVISMTLFASWCGVIGLLCSGFSYSDHKVGDYKRSKYKRWWSLCLALAGIAFTITGIVVLLLVMFALDLPKPTFQDVQYWIPPWLYRKLGNTTTTTT